MVEERRTWRPITTTKIPEREGCAWTPVVDYLVPGKTYRLEVPMRDIPASPGAPAKTEDQKWRPESAGECSADGDPEKQIDNLMISGAAVGALVGKIGGSTADLKPDKDKLVLFTVGRYCVFTVEAAKAGTLYLGANDTMDSLVRVQGQLEIKLSEAL
jgi:hypothetical protein